MVVSHASDQNHTLIITICNRRVREILYHFSFNISSLSIFIWVLKCIFNIREAISTCMHIAKCDDGNVGPV